MADLPNLLLASLDPSTRKQAEQNLNAYSEQQGFLSHLLGLVIDQSQNRSVRLSGSIYLKNISKSRWADDVQPIAEQDKAALRSGLVPAMLALSSPTDKAIRAQIAEAVSLIAELDFPDPWADLIDQLVASLSPTDYSINIGVLETGHSIFRHWRALVRTDTLYNEINLVFEKFLGPFLQLFRQTAALLTQPQPGQTKEQYALLAQCMVLLLDIYYDFTCHDLPPAIEDSHMEFFGANGGWLPLLMSWDPVQLRGDVDDTTPSLPSQIKTRIFQVVELFIKLFAETLQTSNATETFIQLVWSLVGSNRLPSIADDILVSQSLRFISTAVRSRFYKEIFSAPSIISTLIEGVVVPNAMLREHEMEQFEDDPLEYVRLDLASAVSDTATRRQAAADVLQALVSSGYEAETTQIVGEWISKGLAEYEANKETNWKSKDGAIYLLTAVAMRGVTTQQGVTSTNALVDVVKFFSDHVYQDLQAGSGSVHPILQVDAIRFLYTFRMQLTKAQLLSVLPNLITHLDSANYVTYTYAAITIDRILFIKHNGKLLFSQADIREHAATIVNILLSKVEKAGTPEKVAENDHLMKCTMRVIITARQSLTPGYEQILNRLVAILGVISKNPSNPKFDQYIFESLSALMRFVTAGSPETIPTFEGVLFAPFTYIIQQDIDQYIPYVFQILAQMLELHPSNVPDSYRTLLPFLLAPAMWQQKGSIPGLVKLLRAYLARDAAQMAAKGQVQSVLAVIQQRLVPSKINDVHGFELLQAVVMYVKPSDLKQYFKGVIMTILTRLHSNKTDKFVHLLTYFVLYTAALNIDNLGPDYVISTFEEIQPRLWSQILTTFMLPLVPKMPHKERKLAAVGMTRILFQSQYSIQEPSVANWPAALESLIKLFSEPQYLTKTSGTTDEGDALVAAITEIDFEEQTAGYQAAYSRLAASESAEVDPVAYVHDPQVFLGEQVVEFSRRQGGVLKQLLARGNPGVIQPFVGSLAAAGYSI
ncbi:Cse1-domain-containing protein [Gymnopus androsaceus JB14]|uniref:Cse1-domain-containing protein n=1 Tax=Gymnopus androsaceus JB14 TaxID=1447944 RepID=A0A6A4HQ42_9AGAR|nr:Cse1-domain-containing protein [Gymnopus androsaceus JB14]